MICPSCNAQNRPKATIIEIRSGVATCGMCGHSFPFQPERRDRFVAYAAILLALVFGSCARPVPAPRPAPEPPATVWATFDVIACAMVPAAGSPCTEPIAGALVKIKIAEPDHFLSHETNGDGYTLFTVPNLPWSELFIDAAGYVSYSVGIHTPDLEGRHNVFTLARVKPAHVDPSVFALEDLAAIRGAMWTARLNVPYGPRPNQDDNILAMAFYGLYAPQDQDRMLTQYHDVKGFTHGVTGPVTGNDCYHGLYPCRQGVPNQEQWDAYLDELQTWWDRGVVPVYFAKPDGWERPEFAADMDALDALYGQPRAQRLLRVVVYPGWEPSGSKYGWTNATYVAWVKRGARVFPNALRGLHTVSDLDAPTGGDDDKTFPKGQGNAISWQNVAPYIHLWYVQVGGYVEGGNPVPDPTFLAEFDKLWADFRRKFNTGAAGWPQTSAWSDGRPVRAIYAEGASFPVFWKNWPEATAFELGDRAMRAGAYGYLDGGTVPVPSVRR